jgi:molybdate transport system regulatory protein
VSELEDASSSLSSRGKGGRRSGKAGGRAASGKDLARIKLQIDLPGGGRIGPGKIRLLELVETEGSLSRSAEAMGISYRRAWIFVQQINAAFDEPSIATPEHGHGGAAAKLTDFGRELIARYRALEEASNADGRRFISWLARHRPAEKS